MKLKYITVLYKYRRAFLAFEPADRQCHFIAQIPNDCEAASGFRMFFTLQYVFILLSIPKHYLLESWPRHNLNHLNVLLSFDRAAYISNA